MQRPLAVTISGIRSSSMFALLLQCASTCTCHSGVDARLPCFEAARALLLCREDEAKEFQACLDNLKAGGAIIFAVVRAHVRIQARTHGCRARDGRHMRGELQRSDGGPR